MSSPNKTNKLAYYKQNFDTLVKSYNSLKVILQPNLPERRVLLMNLLIDTVISQLQIYMDLLSTKDLSKIYGLLNLNNQVLSQRISAFFKFYENPNTKKRTPSASFSDPKEIELNEHKRKEEIDEEKIKQNQTNYDTILQKNNDNYDKDEENNNDKKRNGKEMKIENKEKNEIQIKPKTLTINTTLNNRYNIIKPKLINNIYPPKDQPDYIVNTVKSFIKSARSKEKEEKNFINNKINNNNNLTESSSCIYKKPRNKNKIQKIKYNNVQSKLCQYIKNNDNNNLLKNSLNKSKGTKISPKNKSDYRFMPKISKSRDNFKKPSLFDKSIVKICHNAINDYKELQHKNSDFDCPKKKRSWSFIRTAINEEMKRTNSTQRIKKKKIPNEH